MESTDTKKNKIRRRSLEEIEILLINEAGEKKKKKIYKGSMLRENLDYGRSTVLE